ncbi:hepatocyte growth factor receptor-like [Babylonia areolata]|uniref:hepatocyte growth factor receptor-like n=1 Tax=Babylonia areolata TaxID=304850 RepID=UPI003FD42414
MEFFMILCVTLPMLGASTSEHDHYQFPTEVFQVALDPRTQSVYVGGMNTVYRLTTNLTLVDNTTLTQCDQDVCGNAVRVLEVDNTLNRLLACGADGQCWLLGLSNFANKQPLSSEEEGEFLPHGVESLQLRKVIHTGNSGVSKWMIASHTSTVKIPILSVREIMKSDGAGFEWKYGQTNQSKSLITKNTSRFSFDLLDGFCLEQGCFYLTRQGNFSMPINRLANVCASSLFPYVEKALKCSDKTHCSNLVAMTQGRMGEKVYVITVASTDIDRTTVFGLNGIKLDDVNKELKKARRICSDYKAVRESVASRPSWYYGSSAPCIKQVAQEGEQCPSGEIVNPVLRSDYPRIKISKKWTEEKADGNVTSVFTHTEPLKGPNGQTRLDDQMTIYVVTSTGRIVMFNAMPSLEGLSITLVGSQHIRQDSQLSAPLDLRRDVAASGQHFYLLLGTELIRRPLDPCLDITDCAVCKYTKGCGWCIQESRCRFEAQCHTERCPPQVKKIKPSSGPVTGGTTMTLTVNTNNENKILICQQPCPVVKTDENGPYFDVKCRVPESAIGPQKRCDVTITFPATDQDISRNITVTAPVPFVYTTPEVYDFTPVRMLWQERGVLSFRGRQLDSGSDVTVSGDDVKICDVISRNSSRLQCRFTAESSDIGDPRCYNLTVTIDRYNQTWNWTEAASAHNTKPPVQFCRMPNPEISSVASSWTFRGGNTTLQVTGQRLDLAYVAVHLTVNGQKSTNGNCTVCRNDTDGTCLDCRTPNITHLTEPDIEAVVGFEMRGLQSLEEVSPTSSTRQIVVRVLADPRFSLMKAEHACLRVSESGELKIQGWAVPRGVRYAVSVGDCPCGPESDFPSTSTTVSCGLQSVWSCLSFPGSTSCDWRGSGRGSVCARNVQVVIEGRRFVAGCVYEASQPPSPDSKLLVVILGVVGSVVLFVLLIVACCCYVRYRKNKFYKRRYEHRHSAISDGTLLSSPSESGGSAEARFVSLDRLLNPDGDPKKQREIEASGIIIHRRNLDLGNVVGHGNFGCVFEGHYQREEGNEDSWEKVAVKTLINPATHAIDLKTFIDEAMLMKNFEHDHVLGLLGLSTGDHGPLVVLPFMDRGDILTYVKNEDTELTLGDILVFSKDIANGMDYLASSKFVHRDLAARNCMLDDKMRVKVADFGLCRDVYEKGYYHSDNKKKLPIRWMPPESIEKGTYTSKSDVWSMGVVMWEMLTRGIMPYPGVEGWDILRYLLAGRRLDQPALCPDAVYALLERCWRLEPLERPAFRDIEHDLCCLTSALQDPSAPYATIHVLTPITFPACRHFKDDDAIVAKVKQAMTQGANAYSLEKMSPGSAENKGACAAELPAPVCAEGPPLTPDPSAEDVPSDDICVNQRTEAVEYIARSHSVQSGPVIACAQPPDVRDDGYFLLERDAATPDSSVGKDPAVLLSPPPRGPGGSGEGLDDSSDPVVSWQRLTELRTTTGKDDGYFELEREESRL